MENQLLELFFNKQKKMKTGPAVISSDAAKALNIAQNDQTKVQIVAVRAAERTSITPTIAEPTKSDGASIGTKLSKPFIQVGIFGVENNANKTKDQMLKLNVPVNILDFQIKGKEIRFSNKSNMAFFRMNVDE